LSNRRKNVASRPGLWRLAAQREFNVGLDSTNDHVAAQFAPRRDTLRRILRLGATLGVTVYKAEPEAQKIDGNPGILPT
jgi:hypothetical protein